jgi:signal peptidase I
MGRKIIKIASLSLFLLLLLILASRVAGYRIMRYPADAGRSMYPTVSPGDYWLCRMERDISSNELKPRTVVLFPKQGQRSLLTKRIIAVENETVEVRGRAVVINGKKIDEPYAYFSGENPSGINSPHRNEETGAVEIPPSKLFVMGDNRDNSLDSRDPEFGLVDVRDIVGKPLLILWAKDKSRIGRSMRSLSLTPPLLREE